MDTPPSLNQQPLDTFGQSPVFKLMATCAGGLEKVVARELEALGYAWKITGTGRVSFEGGAAAIAQANLHLRVADRVLLEVGRFEARDFDQLFESVMALPWHEFVPQDAHFPVKGRSVKSQLSSVPAIQRTVKKAIVESLLDEYGEGDGSGVDGGGLVDDPNAGPRCVIEVALREDEAVLTLDTSGVGLHKRGYRELTGKAPLKETLAAGLVMLSHWRPERPLMDPFCGTGTILIEAAMIARKIPPGLLREFDAEFWPCVGKRVFEQAREQAKEAILPQVPVRLVGTDIDPEALSYARHHARKAGVSEDIHFQERDFADLAAKQEYGCVVTNPPYGERLYERSEYEEDPQINIHELYRSMPSVLAGLPTWSHFILTGYPDFEALIKQQANRRRKLYNAQIACTYYQFYGPKPPSMRRERQVDLEPVQSQSQVDSEEELDHRPIDSSSQESRSPQVAFGGLDDHSDDQAQAFANRLIKNARHLRKWPAKGIHCYRLYERDIPEVPLVVDRYHDCLHIAEYERPNEHTLAQHDQWLEKMCDVAAQALEIQPGNVYLKTRHKQRGDRQHERVGDAKEGLMAQENGLRFYVNLSDYIDTGLFLDHRQTRDMVRQRASGRRFLNLFCYTGSFSVYAAAGGARSTTSVDLSNTYLRWAQENFELNGFDPYGQQHQFLREDVMHFVQDHPRLAGGSYDLAIVDPPTFSNSKRLDDVFDVQQAHVELLSNVAELMSPGGLVYFSTNNRRFKLDEAGLSGFAKINEISKQTVPEDYRNKRIHRCWALVKPK